MWAQRYGALAALVVLFVYNAVDDPVLPDPQSLLFILLRQAAPIAIVAVGMAIVIGTGGIDLSVGSVMAIAGQYSPAQHAEQHKMCTCVSRVAGGSVTIEPAWRGDPDWGRPEILQRATS